MIQDAVKLDETVVWAYDEGGGRGHFLIYTSTVWHIYALDSKINMASIKGC